MNASIYIDCTVNSVSVKIQLFINLKVQKHENSKGRSIQRLNESDQSPNCLSQMLTFKYLGLSGIAVGE